MKVRTYINEGPGMLWHFEPGDRLVEGPVVTLADADPSDFPGKDFDIEVAERVWLIGNRMAPDVAEAWWPSTVRSLSMGDVIVIGEAAYTAVSVGWERIETADLARSLDTATSTRSPRLEAWEARRTIYEGKSGGHSDPCTLVWCRRPTCRRVNR